VHDPPRVPPEPSGDVLVAQGDQNAPAAVKLSPFCLGLEGAVASRLVVGEDKTLGPVGDMLGGKAERLHELPRPA
jgi:hypothetical protein